MHRYYNLPVFRAIRERRERKKVRDTELNNINSVSIEFDPASSGLSQPQGLDRPDPDPRSLKTQQILKTRQRLRYPDQQTY